MLNLIDNHLIDLDVKLVGNNASWLQPADKLKRIALTIVAHDLLATSAMMVFALFTRSDSERA